MSKKSKRIVIGYDDNGNQIRKRVYGKNEIELAKNIARIQYDIEQGYNPSNITFGQYSQKWLKLKEHKSHNTKSMYNYLLGKFEPIDRIMIKDVRHSDLQQLINDHWEHATLCKQMNMALRAIFKAALNDGILVRNPADKLELPVVQKQQRLVINEKLAEAIKSAELGKMERMYVDILFYFGLRPGEALALTKSDFNMLENTVTISKAVYFDTNQAKLKSTKTYNSRTIPIPYALLPNLKIYLSSMTSLYLFTMQNGQLVSKSSLNKMWKRIKTAINESLGGNKNFNMLSGFTQYTFRRSFATRLYYSGISLKKASELMGHSDTKMITEIYAQIQDSEEPLEEFKKMCM